MRAGFAVLLASAMTATVFASQGPGADVGSRAKGADRVVVAKVTDVHSRFDVNQWGDQLIVSDVDLDVEETLKGAPKSKVSVTIEGGTVGDITLDVSDMPSMKKNDRAVLFLNEEPGGKHLPWGRGNGVMKLDGANNVEESDETLDDVKRKVKDAR